MCFISPINLSILDFKFLVVIVDTQKQIPINLSILDFKSKAQKADI